jgi:hypothetical protein
MSTGSLGDEHSRTTNLVVRQWKRATNDVVSNILMNSEGNDDVVPNILMNLEGNEQPNARGELFQLVSFCELDFAFLLKFT